MAHVFGDSSIQFMPTGAIAVTFKKDGALPTDITVTVEDEDENVTEFENLELLPIGSKDWQRIELTGVVPYNATYTVTVIFDGVTVHSDVVTNPYPGKKRMWVLRQRIYEILLDGALRGEIETEPFGSGHFPGCTKQDFKPKSGYVVEVKPAYSANFQQHVPGYGTQTTETMVPIAVYGNVDDTEDTEGISNAFEEVMSYLIAQDWYLAGFGIIQSGAEFTGNQPEITDDRKMGKVEGAVSVNIMSKIEG